EDILKQEEEAQSMEITIAKQRQQLLGCLGLSADGEDVDGPPSICYGGVAALINSDDIKIRTAEHTASCMVDSAGEELSSRMKNACKRRLKR
ncbi:unnamed protein product, partial [Chrysoparadoxa australica]